MPLISEEVARAIASVNDILTHMYSMYCVVRLLDTVSTIFYRSVRNLKVTPVDLDQMEENQLLRETGFLCFYILRKNNIITNIDKEYDKKVPITGLLLTTLANASGLWNTSWEGKSLAEARRKIFRMHIFLKNGVSERTSFFVKKKNIYTISNKLYWTFVDT